MTRRLLALALGATLPACTGLVVADRQPDDVPGAAPGGTATMPAGAAPATKGAVPDSCKGDEVPGPRRLRLLTRAEYARTVSDLLGIPAPQIDNLPVESVVDGFDT